MQHSLSVSSLRHYWRRASFEVWRYFRPNYRIRIADRSVLVVPAIYREAARLAKEWRPDWKALIIDRVLAMREGQFLDIGANIGQTLFDYCASGRRSQYIGFEPNPHCVELLSEIIAINQLSDCLIAPVGLSDQTTILRLMLAKGSLIDSGASTVLDLRPKKECDIQFIPCYRFDDIRDLLGIGEISLIKIDVEGAEALVLEGMSNTLGGSGAKPWVICEVLHRDANAEVTAYATRIHKLEEIIGAAGYLAMRIDKSRDGRKVEGFTPVTTFPNLVWTREKAAECDYLLVPRADAESVDRLVG